MSSDAKALDGLNVQVAVCDEIASHKTSEVYDVLLTAMGKRRHPLLLSISTATGNTSGIGRQLWDYAARVLDGAQQDDRLFALVYAADETDDPWDEKVWIKANPSLPEIPGYDYIRGEMRRALAAGSLITPIGSRPCCTRSISRIITSLNRITPRSEVTRCSRVRS